MRPIFAIYPALEPKLPCLPLRTLPTPVNLLDGLCSHLHRNDLYIKRDDLSGNLYGGNKVRKLEFLLADAKKSGATRIITSGAAGSNHALATALYSRKCGFDVTLMLGEQPWNPSIPATLLADFATGAEMHLDKSFTCQTKHIAAIIESYTHREGKKPYCIPAGGSSSTGVIGYVNAAFELKEQINSGAWPEPYAIYCALGTMGTAAGLLLGMRAAGIKSRLIAVRVVPAVVASGDKLLSLCTACNQQLLQIDPSFPEIHLNHKSFSISDDFFGEDYGITTPEALSAIETMKNTDNISLDPVYTGKAAAAFLADANNPDFADKPLLFLHSKSSHYPETDNSITDYHQLPHLFHHYFSDYKT